MYSSITRTCTFVLISLSVLYASTSCSDNKEPETGPVHEKELKEYANLTYTCGETLINVLDDIFQANMYIQADGDTELQQDIVRKYFPAAELDYDETAGTIYVNKRRSLSFDITTGGVGSGTGSSSLLHDQKLVDNKTVATSNAACPSRLFFILQCFLFR